MDYKEKYLKGLERAKKTLDSLDENYRCHELTKDDIRIIYSRLFPELAESEDERIRKELIFFLKKEIPQCSIKEHADKLNTFVSYLEKQKEQKQIDNPNTQNIIKSFVDSMSPDESLTGIEHDLALYAQLLAHYKAIKSDVQYNNALKGFAIAVKESLNEQKEQKPDFSEKDSTDFEIEVHEIIAQARNDSRLNDADVLKQFEEEAAFALMLKANKLIEQQKPAEWSEEDKDMLNCCISSIEEAKENRYAYKETDGDTSYDREIAFLKSLRPSWKPSEHQMNILKAVKEYVGRGSGYWGEGLGSLIEDLEKLM